MISLKIKVTSEKFGSIIGKSDSGIEHYLGIPFAKAKRFEYADLIRENYEEYDATTFRGTPIQIKAPWMGEVPEPSENCLFLNIWRKSGSQSNLPVIFWIFGGGFEGGTASTAMYSGNNIVESGEAIFVSANYRVGFLGFGYLEDEIPSNLGVSDILRALEWVSENISTFGGDPTNVTVMGQSAGGFIAASLSAIPEAKKYFAKLIMLSGAASRIVPLERAQELTNTWKVELAKLGYSLSNAPIDAILEMQAKVISKDIGIRNATKPNALGVTLDAPHGLLQNHPFESLTSENSGDVVISFTNSEIASFRRFAGLDFDPNNIGSLKLEISNWGIAPDRVQNIIDFYESKYGSNLGKLREVILTDWIYRLPAIRLAFERRKLDLRTYIFEFSNLDGSDLGHGEDLKFTFKSSSEITSPERAVSDKWISLILQFARAGRMEVADISERLEVTNLGKHKNDEWQVFQEVLEVWEGVERP